MEVRRILTCLVCLIMVGGFLAQMWNLFEQFVSGLKTVAISFEDKSSIEFPSFAFCDSRAFKKVSRKTANAARYNATTINLVNEVTLLTIGKNDDDSAWKEMDDWQSTYKAQYLPTVYNGNCMLFKFHRDYTSNTWGCKYILFKS